MVLHTNKHGSSCDCSVDHHLAPAAMRGGAAQQPTRLQELLASVGFGTLLLTVVNVAVYLYTLVFDLDLRLYSSSPCVYHSLLMSC